MAITGKMDELIATPPPRLEAPVSARGVAAFVGSF
jgi:hypothetical protein